jgi:hypothetical protein
MSYLTQVDNDGTFLTTMVLMHTQNIMTIKKRLVSINSSPNECLHTQDVNGIFMGENVVNE